MDRIVYLELAGEKYPLLFSMQAMLAICERFGGLSEMLEKIQEEKKISEQLKTMFWIITVFSESAVNFLRVKGKKEQKSITEELLMLGVNPFEIGFDALWVAVNECMTKGSKQTVEVKDNIKNAVAAQG